MSTTIQQGASPFTLAITEPLTASGSWSLDRAYEYCAEIARAHYENFPVGSALVPKHLRKHFYSIYAFARIADDFADERYGEGPTEADRLEALDEWRRLLIESFAGRAHHPVFVALAQTASEFKLPISLFDDLLSAFAQDVRVRRYENFGQLLDYCRRSANPVGRLVLRLFGYCDEQRQAWSDQICTALQLTNHWQDVAIDLAKDRIYLPQDDLAQFGVAFEDLTNHLVTERFRNLMKFQVDRTKEMFLLGKPLCGSVGGRLGLELRAVWLGGTRILARLEQDGHDVFTTRPMITSADKIKILLGATARWRFRPY